MKQESSADRRSVWAYVPAGLLCTMVAGLGTLALIAVDDPSFAVEPNYYEKALAHDAHLSQHAANQQLGWQLDIDARPAPNLGRELIVRVLDRSQAPVSGARLELTTFHNAFASHLLSGMLRESSPGEYRIQLPMQRPGIWELRLLAQRGIERFSAVERIDLEARP